MLGKKFVENNPKKCLEQGIIHVNVVWQYPIQLQNRVQGPLQQHVIPNHKEKYLELILFKNRKKNSTDVGKKKSQNYLQYRPNSHHCLCVAVRLKQFLYELKKNICYLRFKPFGNGQRVKKPKKKKNC